MHATGTFETKMHPEPPYAENDGISIGRLWIDKTWVGELVGTSKVDMLAARGPIANSAGYVAIERVVGTLGGKTGTFVLQHTGVMDRGESSLVVKVVPDSGTGELAGLRGTLTIDIVDKVHHYAFDFTL